MSVLVFFFFFSPKHCPYFWMCFLFLDVIYSFLCVAKVFQSLHPYPRDAEGSKTFCNFQSEQWLLLTIHPWSVGTRSIPTANRGKVILAVMVKCMLANADSMSTSAVIFTHQTLHLLLQISIWLLFDHSNQGYLEGSQYICPFVLCLEVWKHDFRANVDWILKGLVIAGNMCSLWYAKLVIPSGKLFAF